MGQGKDPHPVHRPPSRHHSCIPAAAPRRPRSNGCAGGSTWAHPADNYGNSIRTLKNGKQELKKDEYFVMGSNPKSYDSRYWGAVKKQDIMYYGTFYIPFSW